MTLRRIPDDFLVDELLRDDVERRLAGARPSRASAVYKLTKTSLTTEGAAARLARALRVRPGMVSYAGLKDKHARTTQHFSVGPVEKALHLPASVSGPAWTATLIGWSPEPAVAAWIRRNRFTITIRDLSPEQSARLDHAATFLEITPAREAPDRRLLFVNYFGEQRFVAARQSKDFIARHLIRADFEQALRLAIATPSRKDTGKRRLIARTLDAHWGAWPAALARLPACAERRAVESLAAGADLRSAFAALPYFQQQMAVEAYQSFLWNEIARRLLSSVDQAGALTAFSPFGPLIFPSPPRVPAPMRSLELPMLSPGTKLADPWRAPAEDALRDEGISLEQLRIPGLRRPAFGEAWRPLFVVADRLSIRDPEPDDLSTDPRRLKRRIEFELPRGAYATVLLRALGA